MKNDVWSCRATAPPQQQRVWWAHKTWWWICIGHQPQLQSEAVLAKAQEALKVWGIGHTLSPNSHVQQRQQPREGSQAGRMSVPLLLLQFLDHAQLPPAGRVISRKHLESIGLKCIFFFHQDEKRPQRLCLMFIFLTKSCLQLRVFQALKESTLIFQTSERPNLSFWPFKLIFHF